MLFSSGVTALATASELPAPVARYTFNAPFGFIEPNAIGADFEAQVKRANSQQSPPQREPGLFGNAVRHGNRSAVFSTFPAGKSFTVSFWMLPEAGNAGNLYQIETESVIRLLIDRHKPVLHAFAGVKRIHTDITLNQWSCIALTHDGTTMSLFVNGAAAGSVDAPLTEDPRGKPVLFSSNAAAHHQFEGLFDEVRVYDRALTADQIAIISDRDRALVNLPPVADAGIDHTLYINRQSQVAKVSLTGRTDSKADSIVWSCLEKPEGASVNFTAPETAETNLTLDKPGDYRLRFEAGNAHGASADDIRIVVFEGHPETPPAAKLHDNPEQPGTHRPSFRDHPENGPVPYSDDFVKKHFPEIPPKQKLDGFARERFREPPPAYQHPRIFFNHEDLSGMRHRLRYTKAGQSAISKVRTFHEMNTRANGGIPKDCYYELIENGESKGYRYGDGAAAQYCNGAFLALIDADTELARRIIEGAIHCADAQLAHWEKATPEKRRGWQHFGHNLLGRYATSYIYDFLYPWMTPGEQAKLREVISKATGGVHSIGMYAVPGGHGASNWICWVTGDLLTNICAIEGEDGFDPVVYAEAARAMKNFYRYGIKPDGSPFEGFGKNSLTAQNLIVLAKRGEFAIASENVYNHIADFHLHTMQPFGNMFITDDLWGSSSDKGKPADAAVLKYAYPDDPVIDFVYRNIVKGSNYEVSDLYRTYTYTNGLVNCWVGEDWSGPADWNAHAQINLKQENQPFARHFNYTNVVTARSDWQKDAAYLYFLPRLHGGHVSPARGTFIYSALGRDWSRYPLGHNHKSSLQHSVITVDGQSASTVPGRMIAFDSNERRTLAACDLRYTYASQPLATHNEYRLTPAPEPWYDLPAWQSPHWLTGDRPSQSSGLSKSRLPGVREAYRAVSLVKQNPEQPYALVVDRMKMDNLPHHYLWQMVLPNDLKEQVEINGTDAIVTDPGTGNRLLVRLLNADTKGIKTGHGENSMRIWPVTYETDAVSARFEVLLLALRKDQAIPESATNLPGLTETLSEMNTVIDRQVAASLAKEKAELEAIITELGDFTPESLGRPLPIEYSNLDEISRSDGYLGKAFVFDGKQPLKIKGLAPPFGEGAPFTFALWAKTEKTGGSRYDLFYNNSVNGLAMNIHQNSLRVSTDGNWYWHSSPDSTRKGWSQIAITYDGSAISIYENGELIKQAQIKRQIAGRQDQATIGNGYAGMIEAPTFFDRALSSEEVKKWYRYLVLEHRKK